MESTAYAHLHRATLRTLHSHSFTSSSSIAAHTLTSLFASYLDLLARSSTARANNSGRTGVGWNDVLGAMDEMGVGADEMMGWCRSEAAEVGRKYVVAPKEREVYHLSREEREREKEREKVGKEKGRGVLGVSSWQANGVGVSVGPGVEEARRKELVEVDEYVSEGLVRDPSSAIHLVYAQLPSPGPSDDEGEDEDEERPYEVYSADVKPPVVLPLSPVSNKSRSPSPGHPNGTSSKRTRANGWTSSPPDYIPDFLPPFPSVHDAPPVHNQASPTRAIKLRSKSITGAQDVSTSTGAVSYARSALANLPPSLLPPITPPAALPLINSNPGLGTVAEPGIALREALAQYTSSPTPPFPFPAGTITATGANNAPARSKAARILAGALSQAFDASDSLFGPWGGVEPRASAVGGEGVPVLVDAQGEMMVSKKGTDKVGALAASGVGGRVISKEEDVQSVMGYFKSPILPLASAFIAPSVLHRTTRILPPPPLRTADDPDKATPLYYHTERAVPAPWCVHVPETDGGPVKDITDTTLPEARLVPTWDWSAKHLEGPLSTRRGRGIVGGVPVGSQGRAGSVAGA
ncbi:hypothetical protein FRC09_007992 [Ceratobasidium sp. 395]|nr:hypothetical protein FRC09_007992 [Ceratobasidium sp. 395]